MPATGNLPALLGRASKTRSLMESRKMLSLSLLWREYRFPSTLAKSAQIVFKPLLYSDFSFFLLVRATKIKLEAEGTKFHSSEVRMDPTKTDRPSVCDK